MVAQSSDALREIMIFVPWAVSKDNENTHQYYHNVLFFSDGSTVSDAILQKIFALAPHKWILLGSKLGISEVELTLLNKAITSGKINLRVIFVEWLERLPSLSALSESAVELESIEQELSASKYMFAHIHVYGMLMWTAKLP